MVRYPNVVYIPGNFIYLYSPTPYQDIVQYHYPQMFPHICSQSILAPTFPEAITVTVQIFFHHRLILPL